MGLLDFYDDYRLHHSLKYLKYYIKSLLQSRLGGKQGAMSKCRTCQGRGVKITMRQLGPGMVQQMQSICPECHGEGTK